MVLIPCQSDCEHSKEGYCTLETVTAVTNVAGQCAYYKKNCPGIQKEPKKAPPVSSDGNLPTYYSSDVTL